MAAIAKNNILLDVSDLLFSIPRKGETNKRDVLIDYISFQLNFNQILGVSGKKNSGKSLFAQLLTGFIRPTGGIIIFNDQNISLMNKSVLQPIRHDINIVPADCKQGLNPYFNIGDNILAPLIHMGDISGLSYRLDEVSERVGISKAMLACYPDDMPEPYQTAGLPQLACLARALITRPKLLIVDDITDGLNLVMQAKIIDLLSTLSQQLRLTMIIISDDARLLQPLCDEILILDNGKMVEYVSTSEFFFKPKSKAGKFILDNMLTA